MAGNQNRTVEEHVRLIREGVLTSEQWVKSCLEKIDATDSAIGAWAHLDSGLAMEQARQMEGRYRPVGGHVQRLVLAVCSRCLQANSGSNYG